MQDFAILMRQATRRAEREPDATRAIRQAARRHKPCIFCCHEKGVEIPVGTHGVCRRHRREAAQNEDGLRGLLVAALDEMTAEEAGEVA